MKKPRDIKPHIGIFGRRNTGKSSFINFLSQQETSIVSQEAGTTTDPVKKSIEIFGIGPVVIIDTAGIDDEGELGKKRVAKSIKAINLIDMAVLVISGNIFGDFEEGLIKSFKKKKVPFIVVHNKVDVTTLHPELSKIINKKSDGNCIEISTFQEKYRETVIDYFKKTIPETAYKNKCLFDGLIESKNTVLLVTPIDTEAPEGRMILPQVMAIRNVLDENSICVVVKETELPDVMNLGMNFDLVVTDSQAFDYVSSMIPNDILLTSFSILFARLKSDFQNYLKGTNSIGSLKDGDKVLILESCTHQVSCDDIGRFKIPKWLTDFTKKDIQYEFISGFDIPEQDIKKYALVVQCGGCVVTKKQLQNRIQPAIDAGIPVTNYGMAIAYVNGIFERAIKPFVMAVEKPLLEDAVL
jgi:[FeFe] hydrogenase H-cluster maturation GTPase HydF